MMRPPDILIDTNLLVLLTVGLTSKRLIEKHKKTKAFSIRDFDLLAGLIGSTPIVILPNVASETSNLLAFHGEPERTRLMATLANLLDHFLEVFVPSKEAARQAEYLRLGLTDVALLCAAKDRRIVTSDAKLHVSAVTRGLNAVNFNHIRDFA